MGVIEQIPETHQVHSGVIPAFRLQYPHRLSAFSVLRVSAPLVWRRVAKCEALPFNEPRASWRPVFCKASQLLNEPQPQEDVRTRYSPDAF